MSFPKWGLISTVVLLAGGAIYGFYIHDYFQAMMCVADIGFFVYAYEHFNKWLCHNKWLILTRNSV